MPNMYTCIAYLIEIRKFCSKNVVHNVVNFEAQNALKVTYAPLISKKIPARLWRCCWERGTAVKLVGLVYV